MTNETRALIAQVKADGHSHVVVFLVDAGLRWRGESESACQCMAEVIGDGCRVMPREEFLKGLETLEAQP